MHLRRSTRTNLRLALTGALVGSLLVACSGTASGPSASSASPAASASPALSASASAPAKRPLSAPAATPIAAPPAEPAGDGTTATIKTDLGDVVIELFTESSPVAAENFVNLAEYGYYDGVIFHRIVPGFVIQGGDPTGTGTGHPGYRIPDEPVVGKYGRGIVAMARSSQPNSQGSQFFIVVDDGAERALESARTYAIFGRVTSGMDVVDKIVTAPNDGAEGDGGRPVTPTKMTSVTIKKP